MYDVLKWVTLVALPALGTAYVALAPVWGWPLAEAIAKTVTAVCAAGRSAGHQHGAV